MRRQRSEYEIRGCRTRSAEADEQNFPRWDIQKSTVHDLVYSYLLQCANRDRNCKQRNCAASRFQREHVKRRRIRGRDAPSQTYFGDGRLDENTKQFKSRVDKNALFGRTFRSSSKECIADYARAVRNGRKQAKLYVREALIYGLQSGLLIPNNRRNNVLRVSKKLGVFPSKNATEDEDDRSSVESREFQYIVRE